jgi:hypothetical protein
MAVRLWPSEYTNKEHISRGERLLLSFASKNFKSGHFATGIDPNGRSTDKLKFGLYIIPNQGLLSFAIYQGSFDEQYLEFYIKSAQEVENELYERLLDSKMLIVRNDKYKVLKFPYRHIYVFVNDKPNSLSISSEGKRKLAPFASVYTFYPLASSGQIKYLSDLHLMSEVRMPFDRSFKSISESESKAIFERLAPEYVVIMNEMEDASPPVNDTVWSEDAYKITGSEMEYRTFFLDEHQVGLINDMGKGHRVILANPGAGKSVLLLSKAFKYASLHKESMVLLTCYNSNLSDSYNFKRNCANFGKNQNLLIMTFHKLIKKILEEILKIGCSEAFPNERDILVCRDAIKAGKVKLKFLAIFIDEVQIFDPLYLEICYLLLDSGPENVFLMAGDLNQTVRTQSKRGDAPWKRMDGIDLDFTGRVKYIERNYRNSREIAEYLNRMLGRMNDRMKMLNLINSSEFQYNKFVVCEKRSIALKIVTGIDRMKINDSLMEAISEITTKYGIGYSDIAILFPFKQYAPFRYYPLRWMTNTFDKEDIPYSMITTTTGQTTRHERYSATNGIVLSTIDSSLGLDFKAVIVSCLYPYNYIHDGDRSLVETRDWTSISKMNKDLQEGIQIQMRKLYTACSRARDILYVLSDLKPKSPIEELLVERRDTSGK